MYLTNTIYGWHILVLLYYVLVCYFTYLFVCRFQLCLPKQKRLTSAPCRASFPSIVKIYQKYKSWNFEIIGVSLDRSEKAWHKALSEETAPWVQLLDAKGFVAKEYAVMAIPHLVLISPEGKIIGSFDKAEINRELVELFGN